MLRHTKSIEIPLKDEQGYGWTIVLTAEPLSLVVSLFWNDSKRSSYAMELDLDEIEQIEQLLDGIISGDDDDEAPEAPGR